MSESSTAKRRGPALIITLAILVIAAVVGAVMMIQQTPVASNGGPGGASKGGMPPAAVYVVTTKSLTAQNYAKVTGSLRSALRSNLAAQEAGAVAEILADEGRRVKKNAVLVKLDGRRLDAQMAEAQAQLRSFTSIVDQREAELKRGTEDHEMKKALFKDMAIARSELLDATRVLAVARALIGVARDRKIEAQSRVNLLDIRKNDLEIRAPFAGLVTERMIEPGEWAGEGQSVMTLVSIDSVEAWLRVPERYLLDLENNPKGVQVVINNFGTLTPVEVRIISDVDPRSRMFTVVAVLDNSDQKLAPGLSLTGRVPIGKNTPHLVIPVDAVLRTQSGNFIFRAKKAADPSAMYSAERIPVTISFEREGQAYILPNADTALQNNDQVVVEGNDRLQPNQPLMIQAREADAAAPTKP